MDAAEAALSALQSVTELLSSNPSAPVAAPASAPANAGAVAAAAPVEAVIQGDAGAQKVQIDATSDVKAADGVEDQSAAQQPVQGDAQQPTGSGDGDNAKLPQALRVGGRKRKVALFLGYNGAGYSVRCLRQSVQLWLPPEQRLGSLDSCLASRLLYVLRLHSLLHAQNHPVACTRLLKHSSPL